MNEKSELTASKEAVSVDPKPVVRKIKRRRVVYSPPPNTYNPEKYVPYRLLWAKVIIRAAYDYALWKNSSELRLRKLAQEAERWLFEPSSFELSFENICDKFNFPIEKIRVKAKALSKEDVKKLEFRERQGRDIYIDVDDSEDIEE